MHIGIVLVIFAIVIIGIFQYRNIRYASFRTIEYATVIHKFDSQFFDLEFLNMCYFIDCVYMNEQFRLEIPYFQYNAIHINDLVSFTIRYGYYTHQPVSFQITCICDHLTRQEKTV